MLMTDWFERSGVGPMIRMMVYTILAIVIQLGFSSPAQASCTPEEIARGAKCFDIPPDSTSSGFQSVQQQCPPNMRWSGSFCEFANASDTDNSTYDTLKDNYEKGTYSRENLNSIVNDPNSSPEARGAACRVLGGTWESGDAGGCSGVDTNAPKSTVSCQSDFESAKLACDPFSGDGRSRQEAIFIEQMMFQGINQVGSAAGAISGDVEKMCSTAQKISGTVGALQGGRIAACTAYRSKCMSSCEAESKDPQAGSKAQSNLRACKSYSESLMLQSIQTMQSVAAFATSKACADAAKSNKNLFTQSNQPNCSNPAVAATNLACICSANPRDPRCTAGGGPGGGLAGNPGLGGPGGRTDGGGGVYGDTENESLAGIGGPNSGVGGPGGAGPGGGPGGGTGGPGLIGGSGSRGLASEGEAGSGRGYNTNVIGGLAGGGNFGGYGRAGGASNSGASGPSSLLSKLKGAFNIKDALPDKDKLARGLMGMSKEAAADGITGAMGETIWQKASRQYRNQEMRGQFMRPGRGNGT